MPSIFDPGIEAEVPGRVAGRLTPTRRPTGVSIITSTSLGCSMTLSIPRPSTEEAAPFYQRYIARVPGENIGEQLIDQLAEVERLFAPLDDTAALARYAPGKWSIKEILGHLTDTERIFAYRLLRIARGDATPLCRASTRTPTCRPAALMKGRCGPWWRSFAQCGSARWRWPAGFHQQPGPGWGRPAASRSVPGPWSTPLSDM